VLSRTAVTVTTSTDLQSICYIGPECKQEINGAHLVIKGTVNSVLLCAKNVRLKSKSDQKYRRVEETLEFHQMRCHSVHLGHLLKTVTLVRAEAESAPYQNLAVLAPSTPCRILH
jgi:hypothetical protein